jgi:hypothetical protein
LHAEQSEGASTAGANSLKIVKLIAYKRSTLTKLSSQLYLSVWAMIFTLTELFNFLRHKSPGLRAAIYQMAAIDRRIYRRKILTGALG